MAPRPVARVVAQAVGALVLALAVTRCTTIDPGPDFVVPDEHFDADYFYCHVEPEVLFAKKCGSGDPALGDANGGCHFNSSAVSGLALIDHPPIDCAGGDHPVDLTQVGAGSPAFGNLQAASLDMNRDYLTAPIVVRPSGQNHPRKVLADGDPAIQVIATWASRP